MKELKKAMIVFPCFANTPPMERTQKANEILVEGKLGFYFISKERSKLWKYEYFGIHDLKSGYAHIRKEHIIEDCKTRLNNET